MKHLLLSIILTLPAIGIVLFAFPLSVHSSADATMHIKRAATSDCISLPCDSSVNIPFDSTGSPCPAGDWGMCGARQVPIQFDNVPPGYAVQIRRVYGDLIGWARGPVPPGANSGMLWGLFNSQVAASPNVEYGSLGCFIYLQGIVGTPRTFDQIIKAGGTLLADNLVISQEAFFLNDTGQPIHMEVTMNLDYQFVPDNQ